MSILKRAFSLISLSCFTGGRNDIADQFIEKIGGDNEKVKDCIIGTVKYCFDLLFIALRTRRYMSVNEISKYANDLRNYSNDWAKEYNFVFDISTYVRMIDMDLLLKVHERIQEKERKIYDFLFNFGKNGSTKDSIFKLFNEYTEEIEEQLFEDAYQEEWSHLKNKMEAVFHCGSWDKIPKFE